MASVTPTAVLLPLLAVLMTWTVTAMDQVGASAPIHVKTLTQPPSAREAAEKLASRILGPRAGDFVFIQTTASSNTQEKRVTIEKGNDGKIIIKGDDAISMSAGLHLYLKRVATCHVSWAADQLNLPSPLPAPREPIVFRTQQPHATAFNYCTFNYTMPWWDWTRWERELDLLALYGVDSPLAVIGTEAIWINVLQQFGYTREEALRFPAGPAYTAWWLMGNCQGTGGPVSEAYVQSRIQLQRRILQRMRELGMTPVMQGFVGIIPSDFAEKNPSARVIPQGNWCGVARPAVLHPDDPLFEKLAQVWYEEAAKLYGPGRIFAGDLFHEGGITQGIKVSQMATKVQQLMLRANPQAIWSLQGWSGNPSKQLLSELDPKHTEVIELCNEFFRNWKTSKGFYNHQWFFSTIIQYGGNTGLHGRMPFIWNNFQEASTSSTPPIGVGLTWESTGINPVIADLLTDIHWMPAPTSLAQWLQAYSDRRYGISSSHLHQAWQCLLTSSYGEFPNHRRPTESIFCARPHQQVRKVSPFAAAVEAPYDLGKLKQALSLMLEEKSTCASVLTYRHDLVDVARQFLSGLGLQVYHNMMNAYEQKNKVQFQEEARRFLSLLTMQDQLLASNASFMLGPWLTSARNMAPPGEEDAFEKQARSLITVWFPDRTPATLADYGWREWSGLLSQYYQPRWQAFIQYLNNKLDGKDAPMPDFAAMEKAWALNTINNDPYPTTPIGDSISIVSQIAGECFPMFDQSGYTPPTNVPATPEESPKDAR